MGIYIGDAQIDAGKAGGAYRGIIQIKPLQPVIRPASLSSSGRKDNNAALPIIRVRRQIAG
jgi:hypothetical protein